METQNFRSDCTCRGVLPADYGEKEGDEIGDVETDGPVRFSHDPRLQLSSFIYLTEEQVLTPPFHAPFILHNS